jgi:hypothetical protein
MLGVVAVGIFLPATVVRASLVLAVVVAAGIWVIGEDFGGVFTGSATDPNSGVLLALLAIAYWPARTTALLPAARPGHEASSSERTAT